MKLNFPSLSLGFLNTTTAMLSVTSKYDSFVKPSSHTVYSQYTTPMCLGVKTGANQDHN